MNLNRNLPSALDLRTVSIAHESERQKPTGDGDVDVEQAKFADALQLQKLTLAEDSEPQSASKPSRKINHPSDEQESLTEEKTSDSQVDLAVMTFDKTPVLDQTARTVSSETTDEELDEPDSPDTVPGIGFVYTQPLEESIELNPVEQTESSDAAKTFDSQPTDNVIEEFESTIESESEALLTAGETQDTATAEWTPTETSKSKAATSPNADQPEVHQQSPPLQLSNMVKENASEQTNPVVVSGRSTIDANPVATGTPREPASTTMFDIETVTSLRNQVSHTLVSEVKVVTRRANASEIKMDLHPVELGRMTLRVGFENDAISATIVASELATSDLLIRDKQMLINTLRDHGLDVGSFEVSYGGNESQRDAEDFDRATDRRMSSANSSAITSAPIPPQTQTTTPAGINLIA